MDPEGMITWWLEKLGQFFREINTTQEKTSNMRTVYQKFILKKRTQQFLSLHHHLKKTFKNNLGTLDITDITPEHGH